LRKFRKKITVLEGLEDNETVRELEKTLKKKLACGGTFKNGVIELQGDHKDKAKAVLLSEGFSEEQIDAS